MLVLMAKMMRRRAGRTAISTHVLLVSGLAHWASAVADFKPCGTA